MKRLGTQVCTDVTRHARTWAPGGEPRTSAKFRVWLLGRLGGFRQSSLEPLRWFITATIDGRRHAG